MIQDEAGWENEWWSIKKKYQFFFASRQTGSIEIESEMLALYGGNVQALKLKL